MKLGKAISPALIACLLVSTAPSAFGAEQDSPYLSMGINYDSGKYGLDSTTTIWDVPLTVGYTGRTWSFSATLPYLHVSGPGDVIPGFGVVPNTNPNGRGRGSGSGNVIIPSTSYGSGTASGMGDAVAQATFHAIQDKNSGFALDLSGRIKFGTADANKGLGTGENDYGAAVDLYKTMGRSWMAFGGIAYTQLGSSSYLRLNNVWSANAGVSYSLGKGNSAGLYVLYQQRPADTAYQRREATLFFRHRISDAWSIRGYVLGGFSDGSPDYGAGVTAQVSF